MSNFQFDLDDYLPIAVILDEFQTKLSLTRSSQAIKYETFLLMGRIWLRVPENAVMKHLIHGVSPSKDAADIVWYMKISVSNFPWCQALVELGTLAKKGCVVIVGIESN